MAEHIQIGDVSPRIQFSADGTQTAFTYPFPIFDDTDIDVYDGEDLKILTTDYTVAGAGNSSGGTVTFVSAPIVGGMVTLRRNIAIERTSDFQESGEFRARVINDELDKLTATQQQLETDQDRSLRLSPTDSANSTIIPDKATRSGKILGFDANGDPVVSSDDLTDMEGATESAAAAALSEANAATSETNAQSSATSAASSSTAAAISAASALSSETSAAVFETNAGVSKTNAAASETNAGVSEINAGNSATAAAASALAASISETNAAVSETNAATSESNSASSEANASSSETNAAASAAAAAANAAGGLYSAVQEKSAAYTLVLADQGDLIKVDATSAPVTITLEALATLGVDSRYAVQKVDASANTVTIERSSTDTINGGTSIVLSDQWELYEFVGDASTGKWTGVNALSSGITGGDGIAKTGSVLTVDVDTDPGLEFNAGKIRTKVDGSTIERTASGLAIKDGGITPAKCVSQMRAYDMPFNGGWDSDYVLENLKVQPYGEMVVSRSGSFTGEVGYIDTPPTGQALIVDILKNGVTIYTTKPQFAASSNTLTVGTLKTDGTEDFVAGDRITFKITQLGSGTVGQGIRFTATSEVS